MTRPGARGGRKAKQYARDERYQDSLYERGVLTHPGEVRVRVMDAAVNTAQVITIDDEFHTLIPPQTPEENAALEESLLKDGCNDALVIWQGHNILIDGHHRYALCMEHAIPFTTRELSFDSREDVMLWMLRNQRSRRNMTPYSRDLMAIKEQKLIEVVTSRNQGKRTDLFSELKNSPVQPPQNSWKEAAKNHETSVGSMHKTSVIETEAPRPIREKAQSGELSRTRAYNLTKALKGASDAITEFVTSSGIDDPERVEILKRLEKSAGSPETNGTFDEIVATSGFHYGEDMKLWCDFVNDGIQKIQRALDSVAEHHKIIAAQAKKARLEQAADIAAVVLPPAPRVYTEGEIVEIGNHVLICADNRSSFVRNYLAQFDAALAFCDPPYNTGKMEWDLGEFCWEQDYLIDTAHIVAVTPGIGNIPGFMRQTVMPYRWSTAAFISNGMTRGALGFGNWIYTALFSTAKSIHRNAQDVTTVSISSKDADDLGAKRQKPPAYLAWLFELLTKPNDVIIDAFGGSGMSAIVAGRLNRRCVCIEKDITTFTAMVQRIEAEHADTL